MFAQHRQTPLPESPDKNYPSAVLLPIIPPHDDYSKKGLIRMMGMA